MTNLVEIHVVDTPQKELQRSFTFDMEIVMPNTHKAKGDPTPQDTREKVYYRFNFKYLSEAPQSADFYVYAVSSPSNPDETSTHAPSGTPQIAGTVVTSPRVVGTDMTPGDTYRMVMVLTMADTSEVLGYADLLAVDVTTIDE